MVPDQLKTILFLTITAIALLQATHTSAEPPTSPNFVIQFCQPEYGNYTTNSTYESNLKQAFSHLRNHSSTSSYNTTVIGRRGNRVYAQYYCRGDIESPLCGDCVNAATQSLLSKCSQFRAAIMWYEECTLQYGNHSLVGIETHGPAAWWHSLTNVSDTGGVFEAVLNSTMDGIINEAAHGNASLARFATSEGSVSAVETAYSLVQCRPDMNGTQCEHCLRSAYGFFPSCCGDRATWTMVFYPSCQVRYSAVDRFYALPGGTAVTPSMQPSPSPSPSALEPSPLESSPSPSPSALEPSPLESSPPPLVQALPLPSPSPSPSVRGSATSIHRRESIKEGLVVAALAFFIIRVIA